jgi:hypothetical protein
MNKLCQEANAYLDKRTGTYEFRCKRYKAVADILIKKFDAALFDFNVIDIGAGRCEFGRYLRKRLPFWQGLYIPFDASIDGIDLREIQPYVQGVAFYVAIEFLEHLTEDRASLFLEGLPVRASVAVVLTTPNPAVTDVLAMDSTHKTPISRRLLEAHGYTVRAKKLFTAKQDTLVAYKNHST